MGKYYTKVNCCRTAETLCVDACENFYRGSSAQLDECRQSCRAWAPICFAQVSMGDW